MQIGPKYKIARRLGTPVFSKTQTQKFAIREQRKPRKRGKRMSDYGLQLLEKQKARYMYGISERQFRNYVRAAMDQHHIDPTQALYHALEMRADNVMYRLGWAPSRRAARQRVSHGHITVNGKRITIPSYRVSTGDIFAIREESKNKPMFDTLEEDVKDASVPNWLTADIKKRSAEVTGEPKLDTTDMMFDIQSVIEFYSR